VTKKVGDALVTTKFVASLTRGFSATDEPNVAVCLLPGTEVAFEKEAECDHLLAGLLPRFAFGKLGAKVARFRRVNFGRPNVHHDALEFANGKIVLLTRLCPGQRATVLQLPAEMHAAKESAADMHPALVP
jgi:hypothetical protein